MHIHCPWVALTIKPRTMSDCFSSLWERQACKFCYFCYTIAHWILCSTGLQAFFRLLWRSDSVQNESLCHTSELVQHLVGAKAEMLISYVGNLSCTSCKYPSLKTGKASSSCYLLQDEAQKLCRHQAKECIGLLRMPVWIGWPYLQEAIVVGASDARSTVNLFPVCWNDFQWSPISLSVPCVMVKEAQVHYARGAMFHNIQEGRSLIRKHMSK